MLTGFMTPEDRWNGKGLPLSNRVRLATRDIGAVHQHMSAMFCPHDLHIEGGIPPIDFRHHQAALKSLTFNATDYGNPYGRVVVTIPPIDSLYLVQLSLAGTAHIIQDGRSFDLRPGQMCVLGSNAKVRQVFGEGYKHFTIKIPKADLETALAQELGFRPSDLRFSTDPVNLDGAGSVFVHLVRTICDDIDAGLTGYTDARTCGAVEDMLKRLLLSAVPHNHSDLFNAAAEGPAPYYIRRVEEYVRAHASEPISLGDMIGISGVSARSLHAGFRRFRDATPMGYLKNYRLTLANRLLKEGADRGLSVTEVAFDCGFTHLSKFARDYQERYGERPSCTLKRLSS